MLRSLFLRYAPAWCCPIQREEPNVIIHKIVHEWSVEEVKDFLKHKMRRMNFAIDTRNQDYYTALGALVDKKQYSERVKEIISLLLKYGANPLQRLRFSHGLIYSLAVRRESELIIKLLHHVEDINSTIYFFDVDYSALHVAVNFGLSSVLKYVMQRKPDVNRQTSNFKQTALHVAVRSRYYPEYSRILLKHGADTEIKDDRGRTAFLLAVEYNILEQVQLLLDYKADPLVTDYDGQTALHYIFLYHGQVNINLLELLCRKGCFTDSFTHDLQTPIQYLAVRDSTTNKIASAKKLVMFGAHLFTRDIYGDTVLHIAAKFCPEDVRFMQFLLKEGAASGIRNIENQTFIDILKEKSFTNTLEIIKFQVLGEKIGCFQFTERLLESINNDSRLSSFLVECRNQMNILITKSFSPQFYLFDVLTSGEKFLVKFSRHSRVASLIEEFDAKEFPLYETDIKHKLAKVMTLYKAHFSCYNFLRNVSDGKLSYYSVMDILKFLSAKDVMRLDKTLRNSFKDLITDA